MIAEAGLQGDLSYPRTAQEGTLDGATVEEGRKKGEGEGKVWQRTQDERKLLGRKYQKKMTDAKVMSAEDKTYLFYSIRNAERKSLNPLPSVGFNLFRFDTSKIVGWDSCSENYFTISSKLPQEQCSRKER